MHISLFQSFFDNILLRKMAIFCFCRPTDSDFDLKYLRHFFKNEARAKVSYFFNYFVVDWTVWMSAEKSQETVL